MSLTSHFLRVFFRSHFKPISRKKAEKGYRISTAFYFLTAWTCFGYAIYNYMKNYEDIKDSPYAQGKLFTAYDLAKRFGAEKENTIIEITGWRKYETEKLSHRELVERESASQSAADCCCK